VLEFFEDITGPKKGSSKDQGPAPNSLEALLARKKQFEGPKSYLEYLEGAAGPKVQFEGPKSYLEYPEGAAGPKGQFEGPKSYLEYLEGAASPKGQFEGPKSYLEYLEGAAGPKRQFEFNFEQKFPRRGKCSAKDRIVEKLCVYSDGTKKRSTKDLDGNPIERPSECKGYIPLGLERTFANLCPLSRKKSTYPKNASSLTICFVELSHHLLQEWPDPARTRRMVGPPAARLGR
jgi:hypothetical protein